MRRTSSKENARTRILNDDEIRAIWKAAEANGTFGALVRLLLLTGQRRTTVASMRWEDVSVDGTWTIRAASRQKGTAGELVLPQQAIEIIRAQPRFASSPYVLAGRYHGTHFSKLRKRQGRVRRQAARDAAMGFARLTPHCSLFNESCRCSPRSCRASSRPCDSGR